MSCHNCRIICNRFGKHRNGLQRFRCNQCSKTYTEGGSMPDEISGQTPTGNPNQNPPFVEEKPVGDNRNNTADDETKSTKNLAKEVHWIQHATFWSQVGLGVIGIVALVIYHGQWKQMQKGTEINSKSLIETQNLVGTSQSQFDRNMRQIINQNSIQLEAAQAAQNAANTARESLVSGERAFVSFAGSSAGQVKVRDGKTYGIEIFLPWVNSGNTPTRRAFSKVDFDATPPAGMTSSFDFSDRPSPAEYFPRQFAISSKGAGAATETIPIQYFQSTKAQQTRLYVWGWITYHDIFPRTPTRLSEFCDEIIDVQSSNADMTDPSANIKWTLALCPTHNCSDEECGDYKQKIKGK